MHKPNLSFAVFAAIVAAVGIAPIRALASLSMTSPTDSHLVFIPFMTLALIYQERRSIFATVRPSPLAGAGLILLGAVLAWLAHVGRGTPGRDELSAMVLALLVLSAGGFLLCYGTAALRAAAFPMLFLVFMIPMPTAVIDGITRFLKAGSAAVVSTLFTLTGTSYHREAFVFSLPTVEIEVADECSGIRSSIALFLTTLLGGHLFLRRGRNKALLAALVVPFAVLKNGIRIVSLTLLAVHVDPGFLTGQLHHEGGIVFFLLALALLAPVFVVLLNSEKETVFDERTVHSVS